MPGCVCRGVGESLGHNRGGGARRAAAHASSPPGALRARPAPEAGAGARVGRAGSHGVSPLRAAAEPGFRPEDGALQSPGELEPRQGAKAKRSVCCPENYPEWSLCLLGWTEARGPELPAAVLSDAQKVPGWGPCLGVASPGRCSAFPLHVLPPGGSLPWCRLRVGAAGALGCACSPWGLRLLPRRTDSRGWGGCPGGLYFSRRPRRHLWSSWGRACGLLEALGLACDETPLAGIRNGVSFQVLTHR